MTYPGYWANTSHADMPALVMAGSGQQRSFTELSIAANQGAQLLRRVGLKRGDTFALWSGNCPGFIEIAWAMKQAGVYMVPVPSKLNADEAAYIINDSGATILIVDASLKHAASLAVQLDQMCPGVARGFSLNSEIEGLASWEQTRKAMPESLIDDPSLGQSMVYSSGTTGKPKGVKQALPEGDFDTPPAFAALMKHRYNSTPESGFIVSAPLYHSGPLAMAMAEQSLGATVILFEKFDPEHLLQVIDRYRPARGQFVPTMFVRLLKLEKARRDQYDVSSLQTAIHSAAPCPIDVKREMIRWWGPVLEEIYGGTEHVGTTMISSEEWLRKPGSVGRSMNGAIRICDDKGTELAAGHNGIVYFDSGSNFEYHNDAAKTLSARHPQYPAWGTYGDIGYVDDDGYLYLSDRRAFMIIAGGVNIYPQEAENVLITHPEVVDVAVFGVPDPDMGEQVKAVVQPKDWRSAGDDLETLLINFCKSKLATLKCPASIDFVECLPRDDAGKLAKKTLRDGYWP